MPRRLTQSINYALKGIGHAFRTQRNLWIHSFIALIVIAAAVYLKLDYPQIVVLMVAIAFVMISEMMNTAIEEIVNLVTPTRRAQATISKDVAAGAVLFASFCAIIIGCLVFIPHLSALITR